MGLTTRPPGDVPGGGLPEGGAPVARELRAIVEELRVLVAAAGAGRALPPLPELAGAAPEPALVRWFRVALDSGQLSAPALRTLVAQAAERLAGAPGSAPEVRGLDAARDAVLRLVAAAAGPPPPAAPAAAPPPAALPDQALALRMLAEEVRRAVVEVLGSGPPWIAPPAAAEDPGNAGAALLGWLRTAAARAGVPLTALETAIEAGAGRALALLPPAGGSAALAAAIAAARDVLGRGLDAARAATGGREPLGVLAAEVAAALGEALGPDAVLSPPPAVSGDPAHVAQLLAGWLRGEMLRTGVRPAAIAVALETGGERALGASGDDPAGRALIETARGLIGRALVLPPESPAAPQLLFRPDLPPRPADAAGRARLRDPGERVQPVGDDDGARRGERQGAGGTPAGGADAGEPPPGAAGTEGPMPCIRRCVDALFAGDAAAYTAEWVYPACFWIDGRWLSCADEAALASLQARMLRSRRERGVVGGRILLLRVDPVSDSVALVHVLAIEERADRLPPREAETVYTTVRTDGGWRVAVAIAT